MAKGQISKQDATQKILELFPGSFIYDKEIRIPYVEEGENIQIKCTLTCAKVNVGENDDAVIPGETIAESTSTQVEPSISAPTQEEKDTVKSLLESFGL
jgi:hypothetical protein